ncbi:MAG: hypothetical protein K2L12_01120, partial [Clostridia bacterium]|nr:hypothetical protein [Clostridia bacterium]
MIITHKICIVNTKKQIIFIFFNIFLNKALTNAFSDVKINSSLETDFQNRRKTMKLRKTACI